MKLNSIEVVREIFLNYGYVEISKTVVVVYWKVILEYLMGLKKHEIIS
jgi:hypothetical protein